MKKQTKFDKWFLLSWKKVLGIIIAWFLAIILHNFVYGLFQDYYDTRGGDEIFFFFIAVIIIPIYFIICVIHSLIKLIKQ